MEREPTLTEEITEAALDVQIAEREADVCALRAARAQALAERGVTHADPGLWLRMRDAEKRRAAMHRQTLHNLTGASNAPRAQTGD